MTKIEERRLFAYEGRIYKVSLGVNGICLNKNAFYSVWNNKVTLDIVYKSDGNTEHNSESRWYRQYKALEEKLTELYGDRYCPEHCRLLGEN